MTTPGRPLCTADGCGNPSPAGFLCRSCLDRLTRELAAVEEIVNDLVVTVSRQDRHESAGGTADPDLDALDTDRGGVAVTPLPYRPSAAEAGRDLHGELSTWVRHVIESRGLDVAMGEVLHRPARPAGVPFGPIRPTPRPGVLPLDLWRTPALGRPLPAGRFPGDDTVELAKWLHRHPDTIAQDEAAGEMLAGIRDACRRARAACDVREILYLGPCSCSPTVVDDWCPCTDPSCTGTHGRAVDLEAPVGAPFVTCRQCGESFPVAERRAWLVEQTKHQLLTAPEMSRALARLLEGVTDRPLTASMIRNYASRGAITAHVPDPRDWYVDQRTGEAVPPAPRYRVGEVMAHLDRVIRERQAEQDARRRAQA